MQPYSALQKIPGSSVPSNCLLPPDFSKVALQLHCDGANGSTTYTDTSNNGFAISATVPITTTNPKFGTGAALSAGGADAIVVAHNAALSLGSNDFTIQGWWARSAISGSTRYILSKGTTTAPAAFSYGVFTDGENFGFSWSNGASSFTVFHSTFMVTNVYFHWAVVRNGTNVALYINGIKRAELTFTGAINNNTAALRFFEPAFASVSAAGRLDEFQLTVGVAEYTADFTPPTQPFCGVGSGETPITPPPAPAPTPAPSTGAYVVRPSPAQYAPGVALNAVTGFAGFVETPGGSYPGDTALLSATVSASEVPPGISSFLVLTNTAPFPFTVTIRAIGTPTTVGSYNTVLNVLLAGNIVASGVWPVTVSSVPELTVVVPTRDITLPRGVAVDLVIATLSTDIPATITFIGEPVWFAAAGLSLGLTWSSTSGTLKIVGTPTLLVIYPAQISVAFSINGGAGPVRAFDIRIVP